MLEIGLSQPETQPELQSIIPLIKKTEEVTEPKETVIFDLSPNEEFDQEVDLFAIPMEAIIQEPIQEEPDLFSIPMEEIQTDSNQVDDLFAIPMEEIETVSDQIDNEPKKIHSASINTSQIFVEKTPILRALPQHPIIMEVKPAIAPPAPKINIGRAFEMFQKYSKQLESAAQIMSDHTRWCTGADGHMVRQVLTQQEIEDAKQEAFTNLLNTKFGKKLSNAEALTKEDEEALVEIASKTMDRKLGVQTFSVVEELKRNNMSILDEDAGAMIQSYIPPHEHGAGCAHDHGGAGGGVSHATSSFLGGYDSSGSTSGESAHFHTFTCSECKKIHRIDMNKTSSPKCSTRECNGKLIEMKESKHLH